jgi:phosphate starvation-inducible PhoH-like protein
MKRLAKPAFSVLIRPDSIAMVDFVGANDALLLELENAHPDVSVTVRGNEIKLTGPQKSVLAAQGLVEQLLKLLEAGQTIDLIDIRTGVRAGATRTAKAAKDSRPASANAPKRNSPLTEASVDFGFSESILSSRGKSVRPKTAGQLAYVNAIDEHTVVFGIGPAGTGKTYLAMAKAVQALQRKEVSRIILTRPAVEAGEKLGFLPGTLGEKIDPYLRPLFDALHDMLDPDSIPKLMASGTIEVAPLAYMRGRTLNDSFVILDEAQNTTPEQMKMFLTRLGFNSKMIVTGDVTQIDLPKGASGLHTALEVLNEVEDMHFARLTSDDVVRHSLVAKIVDAYARFEAEELNQKAARQSQGVKTKQNPVKRSPTKRA